MPLFPVALRLPLAAACLLPLGRARVQDPAAPPGRTFCTRDAADPGFAKMCAWLEDTCKASNIDRAFIADFDHGGTPVRGLGVGADVAQGEMVFCIPETCWLSIEKLPEATDAQKEQCPDYERFAIWLATEKLKGEESFYYPYFATLPGEDVYKNFHPAFLENWKLHDDIDVWTQWFRTLEKCHAGRELPTWKQTKLAYVQLLTRQYEGAGMTPLLDMPNTRPDDELNVDQQLNDKGDFCLQAKVPLKAGTELLVDYGGAHHSAMLMFLIYGFAFDKGHNETIPSEEEYANAEYMLNPADGCAGLRPQEFKPPADAGPALQNLARFSERFCGYRPRDEL